MNKILVYECLVYISDEFIICFFVRFFALLVFQEEASVLAETKNFVVSSYIQVRRIYSNSSLKNFLKTFSNISISTCTSNDFAETNKWKRMRWISLKIWFIGEFEQINTYILTLKWFFPLDNEFANQKLLSLTQGNFVTRKVTILYVSVV